MFRNVAPVGAAPVQMDETYQKMKGLSEADGLRIGPRHQRGLEIEEVGVAGVVSEGITMSLRSRRIPSKR